MSHTVNLSWSGVAGVDGYNVYRGTASGQENTKLNSSLLIGTTYSDATAVAGDAFYVVRSSISGVESANSNEVNVVLVDPPAAPTSLTITSHT